ncbi:hypothetical protein PUN28_001413 [Cardiocondyla obscurior]|uniref:Uncharacterized protein n=1 Tax=Cardiocondyla obscurior TaxID=286306 RepID=A0AAW2H5B7_9HYME
MIFTAFFFLERTFSGPVRIRGCDPPAGPSASSTKSSYKKSLTSAGLDTPMKSHALYVIFTHLHNCVFLYNIHWETDFKFIYTLSTELLKDKVEIYQNYKTEKKNVKFCEQGKKKQPVTK